MPIVLTFNLSRAIFVLMRFPPIIFCSLLLILLDTTLPISAQTGTINTDPDFDVFTAQSTDAWQAFKIGTNSARAFRSIQEGWPKTPALWLQGNAPFEGGVYQIVNVTPGKGYHFEADWAAVSYNGGAQPNDLGQVARTIGIDPLGGTNPLASSVVWSADVRGGEHFQVAALQLDQYAKSNKLTIFLKAKNDFTGGHVDVYFDHAVLTENTGMGVITVAPPTATSAPATTRPATATTAPRTRVAQVSAATATLAPTLTLEPTSTDTPRPLPTRISRPTATPEPTQDTPSGFSPLTAVIGLAACGMGVIGLAVFGFIVFRLLGRHS